MGNHILETLCKDIRYGIRSLLKHPGFTLVAVLTLALGIGINTALFTVVDAFMLRPLPLKDPDSLVNFKMLAIYIPAGNESRSAGGVALRVDGRSPTRVPQPSSSAGVGR
jgi:hypothetical protein